MGHRWVRSSENREVKIKWQYTFNQVHWLRSDNHAKIPPYMDGKVSFLELHYEQQRQVVEVWKAAVSNMLSVPLPSHLAR